MKKLAFLLLAMTVMVSQNVCAQESENGVFNHLGGGISVGTDGIGVDLAAPITDLFAVRMGVSFLPKIKYGFDAHHDGDPADFLSDKVEAEGKLNKVDFKLLFDYYPFKKNDLHLTVGAFIGSENVVEVYNTQPFLKQEKWGTAGITIGDYRVTSDKNGNVQADVKVNSFKPYVGIGYGRAIPKSSLGFSADLGIQIWGSPEIWTNTYNAVADKYEYNKLKKAGTGSDEADSAFDTISKISIWPVLTLRLSGKFF